jgi:Protein of unknown function (DUF2905)
MVESEDGMENQSAFGWVLLGVGLVIAAVGLLWLLLPSIPWVGRLPGDIRIETEHTRIYIPLMTCLLVSVIFCVVMWLIRLFRG